LVRSGIQCRSNEKIQKYLTYNDQRGDRFHNNQHGSFNLRKLAKRLLGRISKFQGKEEGRIRKVREIS